MWIVLSFVVPALGSSLQVFGYAPEFVDLVHVLRHTPSCAFAPFGAQVSHDCGQGCASWLTAARSEFTSEHFIESSFGSAAPGQVCALNTSSNQIVKDLRQIFSFPSDVSFFNLLGFLLPVLFFGTVHGAKVEVFGECGDADLLVVAF